MIQELPELPNKIVEAVNNDNLAVFIGAGVSQIIGCKSWNELAQQLINRCFTTEREYKTTFINYKEKESLCQYHDNKKIITICYGILKQNNRGDILFDELKKSLSADEELLKSHNIYNELNELRGIFVTTNADKHFHNKFEPTRILYKREDFDPTKIGRNKLYQIHGCISDKESLVFTIPQYLERYNDRIFIKFLKTIFDKYVVLFVGYGMAEFELLDFLITKYDANKGKELKHFILLPFFKGEENILDFEQHYYNAMGISVIGYEKDQKGYNQLYYVIKNWNSEINQTSTYLYDSYQEIEEGANNYEKDKAETIFQIIKNDKPQEDYFFKKLASSIKPFPWLKPLKEKGYFDPENNQPPHEIQNRKGCYDIPYWNVLSYLENVASQNAKNTSDKITNMLLDIINSVSNYRNKKGEKIDNYKTDGIIVKITYKLKIEKITKEHIEFIRTTLKSKWDNALVSYAIDETVFPKLLSSKCPKLILKLIDVVLDYQKVTERTSKEYTSLLKNHYLYDILKKHKPKIAEFCGIKANEIAIDKMLDITNDNKSQFSNVLIPTIENHSQTTFPERYECQLVHFVRDMLEKSDPNKTEEILIRLIKAEHPIFKRIVFHIINHHYKNLKHLLWNWEGNPLNEKLVKHELYELLKKNCYSFSPDEISKLLEWIESKEYYIHDEIKGDKNKINKLLAYRKKEWLFALIETKDKKVISYLKKYEKINQVELDHPGFVFWSESWSGTVSPIEKVELLSKSNEKIAEYLINYNEEQGLRKPTKEGLSEILQKCVNGDPKKFANNIKPFLTVERLYQYALLNGFSEAWREKKRFDWNSILDFISKTIDENKFWGEKYTNESNNYKNWIISRIASLIKDGTSDNNNALAPTLLPHVEKILMRLADKSESDLIVRTNDIATDVLNSTKGEIFSAMVSYSLCYAKLYKKNKEERWIEPIKSDFDKRLDRSIESSFEFSYIIGEYLPNLNYLDKKWVTDNINLILLKDIDSYWEITFTGYILSASTVNKELYFLLRKNKHYTKALRTKFSNDHITERLVQHICIGYLEDWENLDNNKSLINKLIEIKDINKLSAIVNFFWRLRDEVKNKIKTKVINLWEKMFELLSKEENNVEYKKIISSLLKWLPFIDEIDDQISEWLIFSVKYLDENIISSSFIKNLLMHAKKAPDKVGEIYLEMLKVDVYPHYKKNDIEDLVRVLYDQDQKSNADKICIMYGKNGFEFLKNIYQEYNNLIKVC